MSQDRKRVRAASAREVIAVTALLGCTEEPLGNAVPTDARSTFEECPTWVCPAGWVDLSTGGCGPALIACQPDGGALPGACEAPDAGSAEAAAPSWGLDPKGGVRGPWPDPDDPDSGVPALDWAPPSLPETDFAPTTSLVCPPGWRRLPSGVCDPQPGTCRDGALALPAGRCTATGSATCHDDASAAAFGVPDGVTPRWVRSGADSRDADGTFEHPFGSVSSALRDAPDDVWIALRDGAYDGALIVTRSAHLIGACASRVTLSASSSDLAVVSLRGRAHLDVRGVTLRGGVAGVSLDDGAALETTGVVFDASGSYGVNAMSPASTITLRETVFSAIATGATPPPDDAAAITLAGARAAITRCHFEGLGAPALRASGANASATITDTLIDNVRAIGIDIGTRASARLTRVSIGRARYAALSVIDADAIANDLFVQGTVPEEHGFNRGLYVAGGGALRATGLSTVNPFMTGLMVDGAGSYARIDGGVFVGATMARCHRPASGPECAVRLDAWPSDASRFLLGETVRVTDRASLSAHNLALVDGEGIALHVVDSSANVDGLHVARYRGQREGQTGYHGGAAVDLDTSGTSTGALTVREALIEDNLIHGLLAYGLGATLSAARVAVRGNHAPSWAGARSTGFGGIADHGGTLRLSDARFERNEQCGVCLLSRGRLIAESSLFADTVLGAGVGNGSGLIVQPESEALLHACVVASNQRAGVTTIGGRITLDQCVVRDTLPHPTEQIDAVPPEHQSRVGVGVYVETSGRIELTRCRVSGSRGLAIGANGGDASARIDRCLALDNEGPNGFPARGVEAADGARIDVTSSLFANNQQIGANVSGEGSYLSLTDVAIRATRPDAARAAGFGVQMVAGGRALLDRVWIDGSTRIGLGAAGAGTQGSLRDVLVTDVRSTMTEGVWSQGFGVYVADGASLVGERVGVDAAGGAGIVSAFANTPARVDLRDVYVRGVRDAQIRTQLPLGRAVSYGLHVAGDAEMLVQRAVVIDTGYAFTRVGGALDLSSALLVRTRSEAGSSTGSAPRQSLALRATCVRDPARSMVATDQTLPSALVDTRVAGCAFPPCQAADEGP